MRREYEGSSQKRRFRQGKLRSEDGNPGFRPAKLRSQRGESLVEVLASVLIGVLAVGLLASAIAVSSQIDRSAEKKTRAFTKSCRQRRRRRRRKQQGRCR